MQALKIQFNSKRILNLAVAVLFTLSLALILVRPIPVAAAQITSRTLDISDSAGGATGVTYTFTFTLPSNTVLQSVEIEICEEASGGCTAPTGWTGASADLAAQPTNLGDAAGWADASTATALRLAKTGNSAAPTGSQTVSFSGVTNPTGNNETFFAQISTYSGDDYSTGLVDTGVAASSTTAEINFTASVDETLTFCTGTSGITTTACTGATGSTVAFGTLSASSASTGTSQIGIGTNAANGFAITVNGATLTCAGCSGTPNITANTTPATYAVGTEQFGMNLVANTSPAVGQAPDGSGDSVPTGDYDTDGEFTFNDGAAIVSDSGDREDFRRFTATYLASIASNTEAGAYTATFTYIATATF